MLVKKDKVLKINKPLKKDIKSEDSHLDYFDKFQIDFSNYKFNREEANERKSCK